MAKLTDAEKQALSGMDPRERFMFYKMRWSSAYPAQITVSRDPKAWDDYLKRPGEKFVLARLPIPNTDKVIYFGASKQYIHHALKVMGHKLT